MNKIIIFLSLTIILLSCANEENPIDSVGEIRLVFPFATNVNAPNFIDTNWTIASLSPEFYQLQKFDIRKYYYSSNVKFRFNVRFSSFIQENTTHFPYKVGNCYLDFFNVTDSTQLNNTFFKFDSLDIFSSYFHMGSGYRTYETTNIKNEFPVKPINIGIRQVRDTNGFVIRVNWAELVIE